MSDAQEGLWVEVVGYSGTERYFVDETFELEWKGVTHTYAVLVREVDYEKYSCGGADEDPEDEGVIPDLMRYSEDLNSLEDIEDEDEKVFVVDTIAAFYQADADTKPST